MYYWWTKWKCEERDPCADPDLEEISVCGSWTEFISIRILVLITLLPVAVFGIIWPGQYGGPPAEYIGNNYTYIGHVQWHAIYGVEGLIVLLVAGIVVFRMLCVCRLRTGIIIHVILLIAVLVFAVLCFLSILSFYGGKPHKTYTPYHSGHSTLGFLAIFAFVIQLLLSVLMIRKSSRDSFVRVHSIGGGIVLVICCFVALSGYEGRRLEYLVFKKRTGVMIFPRVLNALQLCIVVLVAAVIILINTPQFKAFSALLIRDYDH